MAGLGHLGVVSYYLRPKKKEEKPPIDGLLAVSSLLVQVESKSRTSACSCKYQAIGSHKQRSIKHNIDDLPQTFCSHFLARSSWLRAGSDVPPS